jgi:hypothetical protein
LVARSVVCEEYLAWPGGLTGDTRDRFEGVVTRISARDDDRDVDHRDTRS